MPKSLWFETALVGTRWHDRVRLAIDGGRITSIEPDTSPAPDEARHAIAIAGMTNLHSHAFQRGMAGLAELRGPASDSFWTWREIMYRFLAAMNPEDVEAIAALAYMEMLETGFTRVAEFHYLHHQPSGEPYANLAEMAERIAAAGVETGIRVALLPSFYAHGGIGGKPPVAGQRRFLCSLDLFDQLVHASEGIAARQPGFAVAGLAPHSLRAVTEHELRHVTALAAGRPIHIHVAEQPKEVEDCLAWSGRRPLEWLLDTFELGPQWCLIHATHTTATELTRAAARGVVMGLCPITEANLGDGIFPLPTWMGEATRGGGAYGIGTDSNVAIGVAPELRQLEYAQRLATGQRNVVAGGEGQSNGASLFHAALAGGARAAGLATDATRIPVSDPEGLTPYSMTPIGLAVGATADIVELDATHPALVARTGDRLLDGWIFAGDRETVRAVWVGGVQVVEAGRHRAREAIRSRYARVIERVMR